MDIIFIRAAMTQSGKNQRYLGWSDEELLGSEAKRIKKRVAEGIYPKVSRVYTSGLTRCRQTANLIYPTIPALANKNLDSIDYGTLEGIIYGKAPLEGNFLELPEGESIFKFLARTDIGFKEFTLDVATSNVSRVGVITHESVISLMIKKRALPKSVRQTVEIGYGGGLIFAYNSDTKAGIIKKDFNH